ncbi:MAG: hypothetical protein BGP24_22810 [Lysobacterales bacterium 69-70]|nr:MAG: hypothetical protein ABS97_08990 [Xanthomonadaceae bacterium SCN 69-320]ODV18519.1 MAG: hypothetical protein ABT27_13455 [Xanthomonadaceae bacterium SCN 69-25]OJY96130.1 MAG: hypothetical protein BGP24_22810 [Xanthomonadales bacterium 69-70]
MLAAPVLTLCGVAAVYAFHFVSRDGPLCELQHYGRTPRRRAFAASQRRQCACLGPPDQVDGRGPSTRDDRQVWSGNSVHPHRRPPAPRAHQTQTIALWRRDDVAAADHDD